SRRPERLDLGPAALEAPRAGGAAVGEQGRADDAAAGHDVAGVLRIDGERAVAVAEEEVVEGGQQPDGGGGELEVARDVGAAAEDLDLVEVGRDGGVGAARVGEREAGPRGEVLGPGGRVGVR